MHRVDLREFEEQIGYRFKDAGLLRTALTHTSYANEHRAEGSVSNERLEFLGDAILDFAAAEYLYLGNPGLEEGKLSKMRASMVSEKPLSAAARMLDLPAYLRLGKGEEMTGGRDRDSMISDAMEAVIGAVYLDGGFEPAKELVLRHILGDLKEENLFDDRKTPLQEILQELKKQVRYEVIDESGPDHDKRFTVSASVDGEIIGTGSGRTKKAAAQAAAGQALQSLMKRKEQ